MIELELRFTGEEADRGLIDFYDAARALAGFQRSLALVTHLALNGEVITHATALDGARILFPAIEEGSWKSRALVVFGGMMTLGSVGKDSPIGHIVTSLYDYVVSETMGFHPDYDKTLQAQYAEYLRAHKITREKVDSVIEKTENSVADMHRPVVASGTAGAGHITNGSGNRVGPDLTEFTYEYVKSTIRDPNLSNIVGYISSFNNNTFKGRVFSIEEGRPIPFELMQDTRDRSSVGLITQSQHHSGQRQNDQAGVILTGHKLVSTTGRLKRLHIKHVAKAQ